jgi:ribonuclease BN (tRNA processing enzyme)
MFITRRDFLLGTAALGSLSASRFQPPPLSPDHHAPTSAGSPRPETAGERRGPPDGVPTSLILLGTAGGPTPKRLRSAPAQVILVNDRAYVVDCGNGVARQLVLAGVSLPSVRAVFITHHHSDHNADYGNLLLLAWASGLTTPVDAFGPAPLVAMTRLFIEMNRSDIETRIADEGRPPFAPLLVPHEIDRSGVVLQQEGLRVTAAVVSHPPVTPSFAYRFDTPDRSIVTSGDTARSDALVELARGADLLVHEVMYLPRLERLIANEPAAKRLREHLLASHTAAEDVGRVAAAAGVKTVVLSHFVPGDDAEITDEMWMEPVRAHFRGRIVVGKDLMAL